MINARGFATLAIIALVSLAACRSRAEEATQSHQRPGRITCETVRAFVAMVGPEKAEKMAREAGASEDRLAAARRCMKDAK